MRVVSLAGGIGGARFLRGLQAAVPDAELTVVVNTGDDITMYGLRICPDLDTVMYTLGGGIDEDRGWGRQDETFHAREELAAYGVEPTWFGLGDRDLATHLVRTEMLEAGYPLSAVTQALCRRWQPGVRLLPMSDDRVETRVTIPGPEPGTSVEIGFQEYFVAHRHAVPVEAVRFADVEDAEPAAGVLDAIRSAERVLICPSNPIVSIWPVLSVPGVGEAVRHHRDRVVAVSPIIAGAAVRGPADRLMTELGHEASVIGVARLYAPFAATLVVDQADADLGEAVEAEGVRCVVTPTLMTGPSEAAALARAVLAA